MLGAGWLTVNLRRWEKISFLEGKRGLWGLIKSVWSTLFGSTLVLFQRRINGKEVTCHYPHVAAPVVGKGQRTALHSRARCQMIPLPTGREPRNVLLFIQKGSLHSSDRFGYRMHSQGDERKWRSCPRSLLPLLFPVLKCASILNSLLLLWIIWVPYIGEAAASKGTGCRGACLLWISCDLGQIPQPLSVLQFLQL